MQKLMEEKGDIKVDAWKIRKEEILCSQKMEKYHRDNYIE